MLTDALPEAIGLQFVFETLGADALDIMLQKKNDFYAKEKNTEANTEAVLLYADDANYLENGKGVIAVYKLIESIGWDRFNIVLKEWILTQKGNNLVFKDLYKKCIELVPETDISTLKYDFEK